MAALRDAVTSDSEQIEELSQAYANKVITMSEWLAARKTITERRDANERKLRRLTDTNRLAEVIGLGHQLRSHGRPSTSTASERSSRPSSTTPYRPRVPAPEKLDPTRVSPVWRL